MGDLFLGTYMCRRDERGRLRLPAEIVSRHPEAATSGFVLRKGLDNCLVLYPPATWQRELQRIRQLDDMIENERRFKRMFFTTSKDVFLDTHNRIQLPSFLTDMVGMERDVVVLGTGDRYEIWSAVTYREELSAVDSMNELAAEIFGSKNSGA